MARPKLSFEQLKEKWYKRLKDEGFEDIEKDEDTLKRWDAYYFTKRRNLVESGGWQAKAEYYSMAGRFLHEYKFAVKLDHAIWDYHANGIGTREIAETLRKARIKTSPATVKRVIRRLKIIMYMMYLEPKKAYHE